MPMVPANVPNEWEGVSVLRASEKRETERQRDRETERQRDRETERQRDRQNERCLSQDTQT